MKIKVGNKKTLTIKAISLSERNIYIQSFTLNGKKLENAWLRHDEIINGGKLVLVMGMQPTQLATNLVPPSFRNI